MEEWMLNDLLECSVCLERLDISSRVLPCQHTFCKKCLEEIITTQKELRCPECRVLVTTKLEDLPPNVLLMRILEGMKNVPRTKLAGDTPIAIQPQTQETSHNTNIPIACVLPQQQQQQHPKIHPDVHGKIESAPKNSVSLHQPCAKALYDYMPQEPGDLGFKKGDIIILKKRVDANWYHGEKNLSQGFFPASYVQVLTPLPNATVPQCVALYDFKMTAEDEKDCLTFNKGAVVTVIRRVDENWAEGRLTERIGIFPISFVEMNSAAKLLMKISTNFQPGPSRSAPALPVTDNLQNSLNSMTNSVSTSSPSTTPATTSSDSSPSSVTSSVNRVVPREKRFSLNVNQQTHPTQFNRRSIEISTRHRGLAVSSSESELQPLVPGVSSPPPSGPPSFMTPPALYIALYPYKPQKADELELRKGALYTVSEKCQDGWFKGSSVRTQKIGVFPGNYVQVVRSQPHPQSNPPPPAPIAPQVMTSTRSNIQASVVHPPPKLPPRALSPAAQNSGSVMSPILSSQGYKPMSTISGSTSSSASVPAAVVARLATTPAPAPALSPRATTLISPPPNVAIGGGGVAVGVEPASTPIQPEKKDKEKASVSLMKRFTCRKKSSPPLLHPYSIDNPVFEDGFNTSVSKTGSNTPTAAPVHIRSGSCPSQLLQVFPGPERLERETETRSQEKGRHSMGGSQRLRSNKHRPNIIPASGNMSVFSRSISATTPTSASSHEAMAAASVAIVTPRDKRVRSPVSPVVSERFRCITPYPPNSEYELELRIGDIVYVHKKRDDGWYKGTLHRTGKTGLFPASFVESF